MCHDVLMIFPYTERREVEEGLFHRTKQTKTPLPLVGRTTAGLARARKRRRRLKAACSPPTSANSRRTSPCIPTGPPSPSTTLANRRDEIHTQTESICLVGLLWWCNWISTLLPVETHLYSVLPQYFLCVWTVEVCMCIIITLYNEPHPFRRCAIIRTVRQNGVFQSPSWYSVYL